MRNTRLMLNAKPRCCSWHGRSRVRQLQDRGIEPYHVVSAAPRSVQSGPHLIGRRLNRRVEYTLLAKRRTSRRSPASRAAVLRRIDRLLQRAQPPAGVFVIAERAYYEQVLRARRCNIRHPHRLVEFASTPPGEAAQRARRSIATLHEFHARGTPGMFSPPGDSQSLVQGTAYYDVRSTEGVRD